MRNFKIFHLERVLGLDFLKNILFLSNNFRFLIGFLQFSSRNGLGIGFMSSRIAGNDRLGLGSSKIEVLAKNSKKSRGNQGGKVLGEPGQATTWTQHINKKSKNPISRA